MTGSSRHVGVSDLPDLAAELLHDFDEAMLQTDVYDPDDADSVADPLPPADAAIVGVTDVAEAIDKARRIIHYASEVDELGPLPVSRAQIRSIVRSVRDARDTVIVTARFAGPDLVVRTFERMTPKI